MKNIKILVILVIISYYICNCDDCSGFEIIKKSSCESLSSSTAGHKCSYNNGVCSSVYNGCGGYSGSDETVCNYITSSNPAIYKCAIVGGSCTEKLKECDDYKSGDNCEILSAGTNKRCILNNGKCEAHYNKCVDYTNDVDKEKCESNIPSNTFTECKWDTTCNDEYKTYKSCSEYTGGDRTTCSNIKILTKIGDIDVIDHLNKCEIDASNNCSPIAKKCEEYNIQEDKDYSCTQFATTDSDNKICVLSGNQCKEQYKTCDIYNAQVSKENRDKNICESIKIYESDQFVSSKKCVYDTTKKECEEKPLDCSEIISQEQCILHTPSDTLKKCVFVNDKCKEEYKSCEDYNKKNTDEKNSNDCESIVLFSSGFIDYSNMCTFEESTHTCSSKPKTSCDDYKSGQSEEYCININLSDSNLKCAFINNICIEQYKQCTDYSGNEKNVCESIVVKNNPYKKCTLVHDQDCQERFKQCSEYTGNSARECTYYYFPLDTNKICAFIGGKCIEQYPFCSDYRGNDKTTCESIQLNDIGSKCVLDEKEGCIKKKKGCSEATNYDDCPYMTPSDTSKKQCIFYDGKCTEQYKLCTDYSENVEKTTCENIIPSNYNTYKCVYQSGTPNRCKSELKECSDYNAQILKSSCENISPLKIQRKCTFSNNSCLEADKTCLELSDNYLVNEDICKAATTSDPNNKLCSLKTDKSGCQEVNKPVSENTKTEESKSTGTETGTETETESNNFAGLIYLSKLFFIMFLY